MQNFEDLYTELSDYLDTRIPELRWIDLWHNQVNFLDDEHAFPTPAVFLSFRSISTQDVGIRVQDVNLQVDCYVYHETFADTYKGSWNRSDALAFLKLQNDVYAILQGTSGENFSNMRRVGFGPVDTGGAGNLYLVSFQCQIRDYAAATRWENAELNEMTVVNEKGPDISDPGPLFRV